jgi:hypothetical protein
MKHFRLVREQTKRLEAEAEATQRQAIEADLGGLAIRDADSLAAIEGVVEAQAFFRDLREERRWLYRDALQQFPGLGPTADIRIGRRDPHL